MTLSGAERMRSICFCFGGERRGAGTGPRRWAPKDGAAGHSGEETSFLWWSFEVAQPDLMLLECVGMRLLLSSWFGEISWRHSRAQPTAKYRSVTTLCRSQTSTAWTIGREPGVHHPYATWRRTLAAIGAPALTHAYVC